MGESLGDEKRGAQDAGADGGSQCGGRDGPALRSAGFDTTIRA
jgi:hypothetical protein